MDKLDELIVETLQKINNPDAVRFFFKHLKTLIDDLEIESKNEELTILIREPEGIQEIAAKLNGRSVFAIRWRDPQKKHSFPDELVFMVDYEDYLQNEFLKKNYSNHPDHFGKEARLVYFSYSKSKDFQELEESVLNYWTKSYRNYFANARDQVKPREEKYKETHKQLYKMAEDKDLLEQYLAVAGYQIKQRYFLLGSTWRDASPPDRTNHFLENGNWVNGYESEFLDQVKAIPADAKVAIKSTFTGGPSHSVPMLRIKAIGVVKENKGDGRELLVDWQLPAVSKDIHGTGNMNGVGKYQKTVHEVTDPLHIAAFFGENKPAQVKTEVKPIIMNIPLNQILFGPPGTGKTYHTIEAAVCIIEGLDQEGLIQNYGNQNEPQNRAKLKATFESYSASGHIEFVTFHQSFSYEDFIEGIKPQFEADADSISYYIANGVFKRIAERAAEQLPVKSSTVHNQQEADYDEIWNYFLTELKERKARNEKIQFERRDREFIFLENIDSDEKLTLRYPGPTTQPYSIFRKPLGQLYEHFKDLPNLEKVTVNEVRQYRSVGQMTMYWAILNYLLDNRQRWLPGRTEELTAAATEPSRYVLVIDEINRGNVANIFGELITLIETDKRAGAPEQLSLTLPYSKKSFSVPSNLYLVGTMNTADRSVEALDTALRRRFSFIEMPPKPELLVDKGFDIQAILETINKRIEKLLDKDHLIGHSFFINVTSLAQLKQVFQNKINPLLQEYFFGDFGKIGLVLGPGFFENKGEQPQEDADLFVGFNDYGSEDFSSKPVYRLRDVTKMGDEEFKRVINTLLKR